jgi:hypothetical protein
MAVESQPSPDKPPSKGDLLTAQPLPENTSDDELRKLLKARYNEDLAEMQGLFFLYQYKGFDNLDAVTGSAQRLMQAGLEVHDTPAEKVTLLTQYVDLARTFEQAAQARYEAAKAPKSEVHRARFQRLDAEIQLLRIKREADKAQAK